MLAVLDGRAERLCEILGNQQGKVCVVRLFVLGFVRMTVDHGQAVLIVFRGNFTGGVCTENPHLVIKGWSIVDQFRFVQLFI